MSLKGTFWIEQHTDYVNGPSTAVYQILQVKDWFTKSVLEIKVWTTNYKYNVLACKGNGYKVQTHQKDFFNKNMKQLTEEEACQQIMLIPGS